MIANYPNFTKLDIGIQKEVQGLTSQFDPYSDFNFTSLFSWNTDDTAEVSLLNNNLVIKLPDYITGSPVMSILGKNHIDESLAILLEANARLKLVPQVVVENIRETGRFKIEEDRDQFDYVYSVRKVADLDGSLFRSKRKRISSFLKNYTESMDLRKINFNDISHREEVINHFTSWAKTRNRSEDETKNERSALERLLINSSHFNLIGLKIYIDKKCVGFSINEVVQKDYSVCHFQKATLAFEFIDIFLSNLVAKELKHFGTEHINWEQDLGVPGLRTLKESYLPEFFLKKYTIEKA